LTAAEVNWLRQLPEAILVVLDEAYFEFSQTTLVAEVQRRPNWMVMRTFSKAFRLAAHRVGYAIAHPELITILEKVRLPYNLPAFSQATALAALHHRQSLLASIPDLLAERQNLLRTLSQHPALEVWPSAANFIYVRLKPDLTNNPDETLEQICANLKAQGTLIRNINQGLRITVGSAEENQRTLARLQMALV
jgi:histidinol-phosphate aminotransferase